MNRHPANPVTQADIDEYQKKGLVCLRGVFDEDWVDSILPAVHSIVVEDKVEGMLPTAPLRHPIRNFDAAREFTFNSPLGEVCGKLLQSKEIRYFFEEFFPKNHIRAKRRSGTPTVPVGLWMDK